MHTIIKLIVFALAMFAYGSIVYGQTILGNGNINTVWYQKGGLGADSVLKVPIRDTTAIYGNYTNCGRITIRPQDTSLYINDCNHWIKVGNVTIDLSVYATKDTLSNYHRQGGNSFGTTAITGTNDAYNWYLKTNNTERVSIDSLGRVKMGEVNKYRIVIDTGVGVIPPIWDTANIGNKWDYEFMNTEGNLDIVYNNTDSTKSTTIYLDNDAIEGGTGPRIRTFGRGSTSTWWNGTLPTGRGSSPTSNFNGGIAFFGANGWVDMAIGATGNNYSNIYFGGGNGISMTIAGKNGTGAYARSPASVGIKYAWGVNPPADFSVNGNGWIQNNLWINDSVYINGSAKIAGHLGVNTAPDAFNIHILDASPQMYLQSNSSTGSSILYADNDNGRGGRIYAYGTATTGTLFNGELNKANVAHFGANATNALAIGASGNNSVPVIIGTYGGIAINIEPVNSISTIKKVKITQTPEASISDSLLAKSSDKLIKAYAPISYLLQKSDSSLYATHTYIDNIKIPFAYTYMISDETTAITTGNAKLTIRAPHAMTVTDVRLSATTASSSGLPTVDINENGTTILSTKLTIDVNEKTSQTASIPAVISDNSIADDAEITFDIDVAGTNTTGLKVTIIGTR